MLDKRCLYFTDEKLRVRYYIQQRNTNRKRICQTEQNMQHHEQVILTSTEYATKFHQFSLAEFDVLYDCLIIPFTFCLITLTSF